MFRLHLKNHDYLSISGGTSRVYYPSADKDFVPGEDEAPTLAKVHKPDTGNMAICRYSALPDVFVATTIGAGFDMPAIAGSLQAVFGADTGATLIPGSLRHQRTDAPRTGSSPAAQEGAAPGATGNAPSGDGAGGSGANSAGDGSGSDDGGQSEMPPTLRRSMTPNDQSSQTSSDSGHDAGLHDTLDLGLGAAGPLRVDPGAGSTSRSNSATDAGSDSGGGETPVAAPAVASFAAAPEVEGDAPTAVPAAAATPSKIALENMKQGNSIDEWGIEGDGDGNIQGFATEISTNVGGTVDFKIATDSTHYRIDIYRLGYYGGDGARKVGSIEQSLTTAQVQPHPIVDMSIGLIDCGNWDVSASWEIPDDAVSGVYIAKLVRLDGTEGASHIPFVVRDDSSTSDIVFQTSDTTWQAYNAWGGASLYEGQVPVDPADLIGYMPPNCGCGVNAIGRASAVSYNRPIVTNTSLAGGTHDFIFGAEHSAIRWLEQNGYDVSYISGVDASRNPDQLLNHQAFLSVGHDEYWSAEQREGVEAARDAGVNLAFWGGNDMYWKIRWETSIDENGTPYRTMVCYKETWGTSTDPSDVGTGTWRDPRYADPGQEPENALIGTMFTVDSYRQDTITVPYDFSNLRFWRDTDIADLQPGEVYEMPANYLGYEWNSDVENGFRPAGLANLSLSNVSVETYLRDYGTSIGPADVQHSLTMYRAESGALVFSAGTVFWSWALDDQHEGAETPTDPNVQQAMVNMFADMGIQPSTLASSLVLATQSTDTTKPTSTITSPIIGASFIEGQHVTVTGTAQDLGGGVIAGIEVSTDGGLSWFKATGRENWSYNWVVQASGTYTLMSRAVDDSLNIEAPSAGKQVDVNLPSSTVSLWTLASKPETEVVIDRDGVELGVKFETTTNGTIDGIRFYKGFYNTGGHTVSLWTADGTLIATGVSANESLSGWQTVKFSSPIQVSAGTTYVASYHTKGYYSSTGGYFDTAYNNGYLRVDANGGVFNYSNTPGSFPGSSYNGENYWVDVLFNVGENVAPVAVDDSGLTISRNGTLTLSIAALVANDTDANGDPLTITAVGSAVGGTVALDAQTGNVIFTPTADYSGPAGFSYTVSDGRGGTDIANVSLTVEEGSSGVSLFQPTDGPTGNSYDENTGVELGMKFVASTSGTVTGIRYYKPSGDTGTHTGSIWSANGTLLGTVTFTNESLSGWQTATFSNPIQIAAGQTYVASYHTSSGTYYSSANYFATSHTNGPLTAPSSSTSGGNGVYAYGSGGNFPGQSYNSSNYWVDVVFNQSTTAPNTAPVAANDNGFVATYNTPLTIAASAIISNDIDADGDVLTISGAGGAVNGTVTYNSQLNALIFTPTDGHAGAASFTYTISDGRGGTASATVNLTVAEQSTTASLFSPADTPTVASVNDPDAVELGVRFVASASGEITGLRYYKGAQDTGTHVGSLWTSSGTLLASATFTNETASGWQTVMFSQPVAISAGTTYVASYQSNGFYSATPNYFTSPISNGPLSTASGNNGVYAYGAGNEFPNASYSATNYWIDVLFEQSASNLAPVAANDAGFFTDVGVARTFQASSLLANDSDPDGDSLTVTGVNNAVNGTVSFDSQTNMISFTPTAGYQGPASFTYSISDGNGGTASAQVSITVANEQNVFAANATPSIVSVDDNAPVNLGMKFQADVAGSITSIRFYKAEDNTGPHTGYLWTATGTLLASATFTNETASGWQTVNLASPVNIEADTTYVVSYSTNGNYSATPNAFSSEISNDNLTALSSALSGGNGVYAYGSAGLFPTSTYNNTNYYVDVAFRPQLAA
ncbi:DUF4082 domain-containing protein [Ferirhizobium litorale]|uniref:DUF4082 domain-containing protein n=1 Tax=Ferirhizobium litorale TaxID=2927786 RepID=UPI00353004C8